VCGAAIAGAGAGGCAQQQQQQAPTPVPMDIDPAMQRRDWERSVSWYPNGDVVAGVNRFPIRSYGARMSGADYNPDYANAALDLGAALIQTAALPFTYLAVPPFESQVFTEEAIPPTYTAMPDMRPARTPDAHGVMPPDRAAELERLGSPEPLPRPPQRQPARDERRGPLGPGDSDFMSSPPTAVEEPD
jgi:hypothetical protein